MRYKILYIILGLLMLASIGNSTGNYIGTNNITIVDTILTTNLNITGWVNGFEWTDIEDSSYPSACPAGSSITALGDSVTCTDEKVDLTGDTMTGSLKIDTAINAYSFWLDAYTESTPGNSIFRVTNHLAQTTGDALAYFITENTSTTTPTVRIFNDGTGESLHIDTNGDATSIFVDSETNGAGKYPIHYYLHDSTDGMLFQTHSTNQYWNIMRTQNDVATNRIYRNLGSARTGGAVLSVVQDNSTDDQPTISSQQDGTGDNLYLDTNSNAISLDIDSEGTESPIRIQGNATTVNCNAGNEGGIMYDATAKKHYGCDGTTWNALY